MGKKLAIKGHSTRSKEIIELLEMMGGENKFEDISFIAPYIFLYIDDGYFTEICWDYIGDDNKYEEFVMYTLEEFLEKYPYKVGDQVIAYAEGVLASFSIKGMRWNNKLNKVEYKICSSWYDVSMISAIQPYTDYDIKTNKDMDEKDKAKAPCLKGEDYSGKRFGYKIPDGYEFDTVYNGNIILKPIKPQYPKTYKECCDVLGLNTMDNDAQGYKADLIIRFQELIIARDAYWKIAGEQMGLGKPWESDYKNPDIDLYVIINVHNNIEKAKYGYGFQSCVLSFPTAEMRDAFYDNFKKRD